MVDDWRRKEWLCAPETWFIAGRSRTLKFFFPSHRISPSFGRFSSSFGTGLTSWMNLILHYKRGFGCKQSIEIFEKVPVSSCWLWKLKDFITLWATSRHVKEDIRWILSFMVFRKDRIGNRFNRNEKFYGSFSR